MTGLIIRHPAFFSLPGLDVRLTSSAEELCEYLGLDYARWQEGFDTELDVWQWLTTVEEGGKLEGAYRRMVRPKAVRQAGHKSKLGALDSFVAFLRTTRHGDGWDWETGTRIKVKEPEKEGEGGEPVTPSITEEASTEVVVTETAPTEDASTLTTSSPSESTPLSTSPPLTPVPELPRTNVDSLDPERPLPLDIRATAALERWGKLEEYEALITERRVAALILWSQQQRRIINKQKALEFAGPVNMGAKVEGNLAKVLEAMKI